MFSGVSFAPTEREEGTGVAPQAAGDGEETAGGGNAAASRSGEPRSEPQRRARLQRTGARTGEHRCDLENRVQSLYEELAFSGQVHAQVSTGVIWRTAFRASTRSSPSADRCTHR